MQLIMVKQSMQAQTEKALCCSSALLYIVSP